MFPVTRQVRRKRTPVFGRQGARAERGCEPGDGGDCAQGAGSGRSCSEARLGQKQGGLGEREALEGENSVGRGRSKGWGRAREGLGREQGGGLGEIASPRQAKRTVGPPDGQ